MEPSRCKIIVVDRSCSEREYSSRAPKPYITSPRPQSPSQNDDHCACESKKQDIEDLVRILTNIFAEVITVPSGTKALSVLHHRPRLGIPTIVLIDIDHGDSREYMRRESFVPDVADGVQMKSFGAAQKPLYGTTLLQHVADEISSGSLDKVVPIVCSWRDDYELMLGCLKLGAADFLLKPIRPEAVKTLFLKLHRARPLDKSPALNQSAKCLRPLIQCSKNWDCFEDRLHEVFVKDKWLAEAIVDFYTPPELYTSFTLPVRLDSAAALERTNYLKKRLSEWDFQPIELPEEDLLRCVVIIFEHVLQLDGLSELSIPSEQLHRFLLAVRQSYHDSNPYHNFSHAVDVLQAIFHFLCRMNVIPTLFSANARRRISQANKYQRRQVNDLLRPLHIFALVTASLGHDVCHPGVNNNFLVSAQTPLAQLYNDKSVLESFHAMALCHLMKKHGFRVFEEAGYNEFRRVIVNSVLATDMGLHNDYLAKIKDQTARFKSMTIDLSTPTKVEQERSIVLGALIKCADISNVARPYHIAEGWSTVLLEEFICQGDLERRLGLPVCPTNDRNKVCLAESQIGFIDAFALPLFECVTDLIPEMAFFLECVKSNRKNWYEKRAEETDNTSTRHNSSGVDSGVVVSLDSRRNSPIVPVPAARKMVHDYLQPNFPDITGSEAASEDAKSTGRDELSTMAASDAPLTTNSRLLKCCSIFTRTKYQESSASGTSIEESKEDTTICCSIQ